MRALCQPLVLFVVAVQLSSVSACGGVAEVGSGDSAGAAGQGTGASSGTAGYAGADAGGTTGQTGGSGGGTAGVAGQGGGQGGVAGAGGPVVLECPGYQPPSVAYGSSNALCRDDGACTAAPAFESCLMPGSCAPSGVDAGAPSPECTADEACPGQVCRHGFSTCAGEYGVCVPVCTDDSCAYGSYCEVDGHCRPLPCDQGFVCPANMRCEPESGAAHGCVRLACTADGDCDCGPCLEGLCRDGFGRCSGPAA